VCKRCQGPKDGHRHCGDCGAKMVTGMPTMHGGACYKVAVHLKPGQLCPKCHRLLASGAWCPNHGNPLEGVLL
jgi:hypothetical protein